MKNLNSFLFYLLTIGSLVFFVSSCAKDEVIQDTLTTSIENPTVNNDRYQFKTVDQFEEYFLYMEEVYEADFGDYLDIVEKTEGEVTTVLYKEMNDEFYNPEDRYQPFLNFPIMNGLVNEHFEFQIGDVLLTFVTNELILTSKASAIETQQAIRDLPKGEGVFDIDRIPEGAYPTTTKGFDQLLGPWSKGEYSFDYEQDNASRNNCITSYRHTGYPFTHKLNHGMSTRVAAAYSFGKTREEAKIYAYSRTSSSANWSSKKMDLSITIWVDRREPGTCYWKNNNNKDGRMNRSVYAILRTKSGLYAHSTGDVRGQMRADFNVGGSDESLKKSSTIKF